MPIDFWCLQLLLAELVLLVRGRVGLVVGIALIV